MKRAIRVLAVVLVMALAMATLCACESNEEKMEALVGKWMMIEQDSPEQAMKLLEHISLYDEEIALVDTNSLQYAWYYEFDMMGNFRQAEDVEMSKQFVGEFYAGVFDALYEGRATIDDLYEQDLASMSKEEFLLFYAELYNFDTSEALMKYLSEETYNYDEWEDLRNGTFSIDDDMLDIIDGSETYLIGYKVEGDTLTLTYSDGTEVYNRVN